MEPQNKERALDCDKKAAVKKSLVKKSLVKKSLLTLSLIYSPAVFAETFGHDASMNAPTMVNESTVNDSPSDYQHSIWWITAIGAGSVGALASSSLDQDKRQHFGISMILGAASEFGLRRLDIASHCRWGRVALATGIGLVPGLVKEVTDERFDAEDLLANAFGSLTGAILSDLIQGPTGSQYGITAGKDQLALVASYSF